MSDPPIEGAAANGNDSSNGNNNNGQQHPTQFRRQISSIDQPEVKTGIAGSSSNLVNAIVGSGIIGLPYAMRESGLIVGFLLLILVSYFTDKSLRMIVELATFHPKLKGLGVLTFEDLMSIPFGINGRRFILISMFILAYGAMVSYLIIVKDTIPTVLFGADDDSFVQRELVMLIVSACTMLPLSMMRDISQLAMTSSLSVLADVILLIVVAKGAPIKESVSEAGGFGQVIQDNWANSRVFIGLGVLSTAMACQHSAFLISGTLDHHTSARWAQVTKISLFAAGGLSTIFAVVGYLGYLDQTKGDILNNFPEDSSEINAGRTLLAITMLFTYPMESFVARHVLVQLLFNGNMDNSSVGPNGEVLPERKLLGCFGRRGQWTLYIYLFALVPALIFDDIGPVLSLTGSVGASALAYIAPGMVYLGINGDAFMAWVGQRVQDKVTSSSKAPNGALGEVELPVVGDATAEMRMQSDPVAYVDGGTRKPWWWYPTLMPVWVALAAAGGSSTKTFLHDLHGGSEDPHIHGPSHDNDEVIGPRKRDYFVSMILVIFGVIAMAFGVITNIYVQVRLSVRVRVREGLGHEIFASFMSIIFNQYKHSHIHLLHTWIHVRFRLFHR